MFIIKKQLEKLKSKVSYPKSVMFVEDYFTYCYANMFGGKILKSTAVKFKKVKNTYPYKGNGEAGVVLTHYTDKEGYEKHKNLIYKWEKEVEELKD